MSPVKQYAGEFFGTLWIVLCGCGTALLAAQNPQAGVGAIGICLAFGTAVAIAAYAVRSYDGSYFNPAIALGFLISGRMTAARALGHALSQVAGSLAGAGLLLWIASGKPGFNLAIQGLEANGYADHSPGGYSLQAAFLSEFLLSAALIAIALSSTSKRAFAELAPLVIGLTLTVLHLVSLQIDNTSVNPARSTGPALLMGGWALQQLWLFWVGPLSGSLIAALVYRWTESKEQPAVQTAQAQITEPAIERKRKVVL